MAYGAVASSFVQYKTASLPWITGSIYGNVTLSLQTVGGTVLETIASNIPVQTTLLNFLSEPVWGAGDTLWFPLTAAGSYNLVIKSLDFPTVVYSDPITITAGRLNCELILKLVLIIYFEVLFTSYSLMQVSG